MLPKMRARIIGLGSYLPKRILANSDLEKMVDTSDDWIMSRVGIKERRLAEEKEFPSDMGAAAAQKALEKSQIKAEEIDLLLVASMTPDYITPSTAAIIQAKVGAVNAAAFDIQAACTGFLYGLSIAKAYIESGLYRHILLIATEKMSSFIDYQDRNTCVLFGDGASAAVISNEGKGLAIDTVNLGSDGSLTHLLLVPAGGARQPATLESVTKKEHCLKMEGREVFKHAVRKMTTSARECLKRVGIQENEVNWLVPHQANLRMIDAIAHNLGLPPEKVYVTLHKYGNTSASSVCIALDELLQKQKVNTGDRFLLVAAGGGLTWGASVLSKIEGGSS